jgi:monoamine oxidase
MTTRGVIIIGGGVAGLAAGLRLASKGVEVVILEARERLGGRLFTRTLEDGTPIELGAEFIHGARNVVWDYLRESGLQADEVQDRHWEQNGQGQLVENRSYNQRLDKILGKLDELQEDTDFNSFLERVPSADVGEKADAAAYVEGFHAAYTDRVSAKSLARSEAASDEDKGDTDFRITKCYSAMVSWLEQEIGKHHHARILLKHPAATVQWRRGHVAVSVEGGREFEAARALITLPLGVLREDGEGGVRFEPEPVAIRAAAKRLEIGHVVRLVLSFQERFWPVENFGFAHALALDFPTWWSDPRGHKILTGWAGGPKAQALLTVTPGLVLERGLESLSMLFKVPKARLRTLLTDHHYHNWSHDPYTLGAYSYIPKDALDAPRQLETPIEDTLFFAGEATMSDGRSGTVHGAIMSGERAADAILKAG